MFGRNKIAIIVAEFFGAALLSSAVYAMVARTTFPFFAGIAAGGVLAMLILVVGHVSGAHANPAITLGLWTIRKIKTAHAIVYIAAQMLGGVAAWMLIKYFMGHSLDTIGGAGFEWKVLVAELIGAVIFGLGIAATVYNKFESAKRATIIGMSLFLGILVASLGSNGVLNPAVAVGIQSFNWAYVLGPVVGVAVGMNLYNLLFNPSVLAAAPARARAATSRSSAKKRASAKRGTARRSRRR